MLILISVMVQESKSDEFFQGITTLSIAANSSAVITNRNRVAFTFVAVEANYSASATGSLEFFRSTTVLPTNVNRITRFNFTAANNVFLNKTDLEGVFIPRNNILTVSNVTSSAVVIRANRALRK